MKIIILFICLTIADMASYNRYSNNLMNHGMGQDRSIEKAKKDPLLEYKLQLVQRFIRRKADPSALKKLTQMLARYESQASTTRQQRYLSRFGVE